MRRSLLAPLLAAIAGVGCHAAPRQSPTKVEAPITRADVAATRFIAQHNRNAAAIRSLSASPRINMVGENGERRWKGRADGHIAMERGKNFRLEISAGAFNHELADIGSNDQEFWFWVADDKDNSLYFCDHKDINSCQLGVTLQPDWIMEAMGLRGFTEEEARKINAKPGAPGTIVLTLLRRDDKGQTYTKETIVREQTNQILEHRLWAGAKQELLASATIENYKQLPLVDVSAAPDLDAGEVAETAATASVVQLPEKFRLNWVREKLVLDISLTSDLKINPTFSAKRRVDLFTEPPKPGSTRRDLAQLDPAPAAAPAAVEVPSRVYASRPIPKRGISLGLPQSASDGVERTSRRAIDAGSFAADRASSGSDGVIGAVIPSAN